MDELSINHFEKIVDGSFHRPSDVPNLTDTTVWMAQQLPYLQYIPYSTTTGSINSNKAQRISSHLRVMYEAWLAAVSCYYSCLSLGLPVDVIGRWRLN